MSMSRCQSMFAKLISYFVTIESFTNHQSPTITNNYYIIYTIIMLNHCIVSSPSYCIITCCLISAVRYVECIHKIKNSCSFVTLAHVYFVHLLIERQCVSFYTLKHCCTFVVKFIFIIISKMLFES